MVTVEVLVVSVSAATSWEAMRQRTEEARVLNFIAMSCW